MSVDAILRGPGDDKPGKGYRCPVTQCGLHYDYRALKPGERPYKCASDTHDSADLKPEQ